MGSQLVVLRFFESLGILSGSKFFTLHFSFFPQNVLYDGLIIQEAVDISADAMVSLQNGFAGIAHTLVNLVSLTCLTLKLEGDLTSGFLLRHRGVDRQQAEARQTFDAALDALWVFDGLSQHLIATTDAYHHLSVSMGPQDGLCTAVTSQFQQVIEC